MICLLYVAKSSQNGLYKLDEPVIVGYVSVSSLFYLLDTSLLTNSVSLNRYLLTIRSAVLFLHATVVRMILSFDITIE